MYILYELSIISIFHIPCIVKFVNIIYIHYILYKYSNDIVYRNFVLFQIPTFSFYRFSQLQFSP
jgi:hypothetical protein